MGMMVWRGRGHELVDAIGAYDLYTDRQAVGMYEVQVMVTDRVKSHCTICIQS